MTKQVIGLDGNETTAAFNTPCHAGVNGGLPRLYTPEETTTIEAQQAIDNAAREADSVHRNAVVEIARLEGRVTQRRLREAITGVDGGWLADQENLIAIERAKLQES